MVEYSYNRARDGMPGVLLESAVALPLFFIRLTLEN